MYMLNILVCFSEKLFIKSGHYYFNQNCKIAPSVQFVGDRLSAQTRWAERVYFSAVSVN